MNKYLRWALLGIMGLLTVLVLFPFYSEILLAGVFALAMDPMNRKIARLKIFQNSARYFNRKRWVTLTLLALFLLITLPVGFALYSIYDTINLAATGGFENTEFFKDILNLKTAIFYYLEEILKTVNPSNKIDVSGLGNKFMTSVGPLALGFSTHFISTLPEFLIYVFVFTCALYFFLTETKHIKALFLKSGWIHGNELDHIIRIFQKSSSAIISAALITGAIQALVVSLGSVVLQVGDFFLVFVITFFLSFVPVLGAPPVALFLAALALLKLHYFKSLGFVFVAVIASALEHVLRPYLVGRDDETHPVLVLLGVIGAILVFGLPGLFLGPVIIAATAQLYKTYFFNGTLPPKD